MKYEINMLIDTLILINLRLGMISQFGFKKLSHYKTREESDNCQQSKKWIFVRNVIVKSSNIVTVTCRHSCAAAAQLVIFSRPAVNYFLVSCRNIFLKTSLPECQLVQCSTVTSSSVLASYSPVTSPPSISSVCEASLEFISGIIGKQRRDKVRNINNWTKTPSWPPGYTITWSETGFSLAIIPTCDPKLSFHWLIWWHMIRYYAWLLSLCRGLLCPARRIGTDWDVRSSLSTESLDVFVTWLSREALDICVTFRLTLLQLVVLSVRTAGSTEQENVRTIKSCIPPKTLSFKVVLTTKTETQPVRERS